MSDMALSQAQILQYCLKNCLSGGWTVKLLENASKEAREDLNYWKIEFADGPVAVIDYFFAELDRKTAEIKVEGRIPDKIRAIIKARLETVNQYKEQINSMLAVYALHPIQALQATYRAVDAIWRTAGDSSTDWNFYSKRFLLVAVYSSTFLFWLNDKSKDDHLTWEFLDRRLSEIGQFNKGVSKLKSKISSLTPQT